MKMRLAGLLVLMLLAVYAVLAQDTNDSDARAIVIQAMDNLAAGYRYTLDWNHAQRLIAEDEEISIYNQESSAGDVSVDGDYTVSMTAYAGETPDSIVDTRPFDMQQILIDDEVFINLPNIDSIYEGFFETESGWQPYSEMLAQFDENTAQRVAFESLTDIRLPSDFPLTTTMIVSVTEVETETIDGVDMRVFEVEVDALEMLLQQTPGTPLERMEMMLKAADFLAKSELSLTYTLWIGAEDGQLYRGESVSYTFLPYLTEEEPGPPYDLETETSAEFTISQHGKIDEIEIPAEVAALMHEN